MGQVEDIRDLLKVFEIEKKQDLEHHCRLITVTKRAFTGVVIACETGVVPLVHRIYWQDKHPPHSGAE